MKIEILEFVEGARNAKGVTVIIDVFRAFSVSCYASDGGARRLIATGEVDEAFRLRTSYKNTVLVGERNEKRIEGFDLGNSPTEILKSDMSGRTVIHTTTAGTAGLVNAYNAEVVLTGSIVNAGAVARYIRFLDPDHVSLVAMGYRGTETADEDILCAEMIEAGIKGEKSDFSGRISDLRNGSGNRFFIPENLLFSPPTDFFLCTMDDRFSFVLRAERRNDGNIELIRIDI